LSSPNGIALAPDGAYAYVTNAVGANGDNGTVSVINTATNTVDETLTVGVNAYGVAVAPNGEYVYVTNFDDGTVSVIRTGTETEPTSSSSPATPEFPAQSLTITLLVSAIIVLSIVIIAMKKAEKSKLGKNNQRKPRISKTSWVNHFFIF
jgi:YVTN family beta-propeller protein